MHCTLKQILSISKDWQLAIMLEVVTNISIQHANRKTVVIVIFVVIVNRNWMRIAAMVRWERSNTGRNEGGKIERSKGGPSARRSIRSSRVQITLRPCLLFADCLVIQRRLINKPIVVCAVIPANRRQ